jgi:hypothetical protein
MSYPNNHDFGRLNEGGSGLTWLEVHFPSRACPEDRSDLLIGFGKLDPRHEAAYADPVGPTYKLIHSTHAPHNKGPFGPCFASGPVQQAIHPDSKRTAGPHRFLSLLDSPPHKHT